MKKNHTKRTNYTKPTIKTEHLAMNLFMASDSRNYDSLNHMLGIEVFADSTSCGGGCSSSCSNVCFLAGTKITTNNGIQIVIEEITTNTHVLTYNPSTHECTISRVNEVEHHWRTDGYYVINNNLSVTHDHPLWVNGNAWKKVEDIIIGDTLLDSNNNRVEVTSKQYVAGEYIVYNLHFSEKNITYFANNVLVSAYSLEEASIQPGPVSYSL